MNNKKENNIELWIFENQEIDLDDNLVSEAIKTVQQTLAVLKNASDRRAFGMDPSAYHLAFQKFAHLEDCDA